MLLKRYRTPKRTYRNKGYIGYNTQNENKQTKKEQQGSHQ